MAILEVHDIHTYYGDSYVLQGLSLELRAGQILGVLARSSFNRIPGASGTSASRSPFSLTRARRQK